MTCSRTAAGDEAPPMSDAHTAQTANRVSMLKPCETELLSVRQ